MGWKEHGVEVPKIHLSDVSQTLENIPFMSFVQATIIHYIHLLLIWYDSLLQTFNVLPFSQRLPLTIAVFLAWAYYLWRLTSHIRLKTKTKTF